MAKLDAAIERLFKLSGLELVMHSGAAPFIRTHEGKKPVLAQPLTSAQIIAAVREVIPEGLAAQFPRDGTTRFTYVLGRWTVQLRFAKWLEKVRLSLEPAGAEDDGLELFVAELEPEGPSMPVPQRPKTSGLTLLPAAPPEPAPSVALPEDPAQAMGVLLERMLSLRASDLHLSSDNPPVFRVDGDMVPQSSVAPLGPERLAALLFSITPKKNQDEWRARSDTDFAHETPSARFRVNLFRDRRGLGAVLRQIPNQIRTASELGLSAAVLELCALPKGLVLVTGPTGSGKSTTLAAMIDHINDTRSDHIITIEDPIEFVHPNKRCLVNQREVGSHTESFKQALRAALREDPDIILVGELRDLETMALAIETAETGHLVFGTLHTNTAPSTVDRIIDQFPADRQAQVRTMLAESLKGVISQTLCKKVGGGRAAALEVLLSTSGLPNLIREGKTFQLSSLMQTGKAQGMVTLNDALVDLVKRNLVAPGEALKKSLHRSDLKAALERGGFKTEKAPASATATAVA